MSNLQDEIEGAVEEGVPILAKVIIWGIIVIAAVSGLGYALHTLSGVFK